MYHNIGQDFKSPAYFQGRPSEADYDASSSGASNKGPSDPEFLKTVEERVRRQKELNPQAQGPVPAELVTASGSGLDPDISPKAALYQAERIAAERNISVAEVQSLIKKHTVSMPVGPEKVNVLELNMALDALAKKQ